MRTYWSEEDDRRLIHWSKAYVPVAEIAARLGKSYAQVVTRRQTMKRAGRLIALGWVGHHQWTTLEKMELEWMIEQGYSIKRCARALKRSPNSIKIKCQRLGLRLRSDRRSLHCRDIAKIMGLGCGKSVVGWVRQGWLKPLRQKRSNYGTWRFDELALWAFIELHEAHMVWDPERITDPDLREHARAIRATAVRWLRPGEVARRYHVGHPTVNNWIEKGLLPGVRFGNWWIREDTLAGFVPPCDRERKRYVCCKRRLPPDRVFTAHSRARICDGCRPHFRELSTGTLIRIHPAQQRRSA